MYPEAPGEFAALVNVAVKTSAVSGSPDSVVSPDAVGLTVIPPTSSLSVSPGARSKARTRIKSIPDDAVTSVVEMRSSGWDVSVIDRT